MSLQYVDRRLVGAYIVDAWQNHFNTEQDPADGQWFTNGPGNNGGLYGLLTDALATELVFRENEAAFTPRKIAAVTGTADNRNGLTPEQTVNLTYSYQDSTSTTHSTTNTLKQGYSTSLKFKSDFLVAGGETTVSYSAEYTFAWTDSTTTSKSETKTFQQSVPVRGIPTGKVYQVVAMCDKTDLKVPFEANIYLSGKTTANFGSDVDGQKSWTVDAGTLCAWINEFGSAGDESYRYGRDPKKPEQGLIQLRGTLTATQTANFTAMTIDITDRYNPSAPPLMNRELSAADLAALNAKVVDRPALV
jgi:Clostridium epsilon toxin ETX/Bacillus mosquitocidal toxin MTX2